MIQVMTIHDLIFTLEGDDEQTVNYPDKAFFTMFVTNNGNVVEDIEIISGESLRGWTVDVIDDEFQLPLEKLEKFGFEPLLHLNFLTTHTDSLSSLNPRGYRCRTTNRTNGCISKIKLFFLNLSQTTQDLLVYGLTGFGALLVIILFMRSRAENKENN